MMHSGIVEHAISKQLLKKNFTQMHILYSSAYIFQHCAKTFHRGHYSQRSETGNKSNVSHTQRGGRAAGFAAAIYGD